MLEIEVEDSAFCTAGKLVGSGKHEVVGYAEDVHLKRTRIGEQIDGDGERVVCEIIEVGDGGIRKGLHGAGYGETLVPGLAQIVRIDSKIADSRIHLHEDVRAIRGDVEGDQIFRVIRIRTNIVREGDDIEQIIDG